MNIVLDSNILFTFFWKNSVLAICFQRTDINFFCPEFGLEELEKYADEIQEKTGISSSEFKKRKEELYKRVLFVSEKEYCRQFKTVLKAIHLLQGDLQVAIIDDIDFLALAVDKHTILWSNEQRLKKQIIIEVLTTKEIINLLY